MKNTMQMPARNDGFSAVLRETVEGMRSQLRCNPLTVDGLNDILSEGSLYDQYIDGLTGGMSADSAEVFRNLAENTRYSMLQEASLSALQPVSALNMPMLRKAWPKIGIKEALPTAALKVPEITVPHLIPHIIDPDTGVKRELPAALRGGSAVASSQKRVATTAQVLPLSNADVMPAGCPVSGGYALDPVFAVTGVDIVVEDSGSANPETLVNVKVYDGRAETLANGSFRFTVTAEHSTGHATSDTVFGYVDFAAGTVTATNLNTGSASDTVAKITKIYLSGRVETTNNKRTTEVGFSVTNTKITVGTGEHFSANLPLEWLQDNLAMYNLDGTLKVIDIMTEVLAQKVDIEGIEFLQASFARLQDEQPTVNYERTFDVHPTGNFVHSPTEWIQELKRVIDNLASTMRDDTFFSGGRFVIVGNPVDMDLLPNATWTFTSSEDGSERDGVQVTYSLGAMKGSNRYALFSSQNITRGALWVFFVPSQEDHRTYQYYPYTFNVMKTSEGFIVGGGATPGVMMTKRHKFHSFREVIGKVNILHNDGSSPA